MFIHKKVCYRFWPSHVSLNSIELESYGSNRTSNLRRSRYVCARKTSLGPYVGNGLKPPTKYCLYFFCQILSVSSVVPCCAPPMSIIFIIWKSHGPTNLCTSPGSPRGCPLHMLRAQLVTVGKPGERWLHATAIWVELWKWGFVWK